MILLTKELETWLAEAGEVQTKRFTISRMYADHSYPPRSVPYIRLRGRWLEDLGFRPGLEYTAYFTPNLLILVPDPLDPQSIREPPHRAQV